MKCAENDGVRDELDDHSKCSSDAPGLTRDINTRQTQVVAGPMELNEVQECGPNNAECTLHKR